MAPVEIEVQNPITKTWIKTAEVKPGDRPGSLSDNTLQGRQVYLFFCKDDDSGSIISRSKAGFDVNLSVSERKVTSAGFEKVKELSRGESFEMTVKTDRSPAPLNIRIIHK